MPTSIVSPESFSSFGDLLKHLRLRAGLTQRELAIALGYNFAHLSRLEHNQRVPDSATVKALFIPALDLGDEPAWATRLLQLAQAARSERGARPAGMPAVTRPQAGSGSLSARLKLPNALAPLVGRHVTLEAVEAMLTHEGVRLLTLLGPPGIGKTRLAEQVAVDLADQFADGARFADLTAARTAEDVIRTVAEACELGEVLGESPADSLAGWLGSRELLLVLDNFEHVVATAPKLTRWLQAAPGLTLLVTSREALRLAGEFQFPVPPLAVPAGYRLAPEQDPRVAVAGYPSVELFVKRARTARPDFELTAENAPQVAELCFRLDGLPLAIELAAARIRHLSLVAMLDRLDRRLHWLTGGPRECPAWRQSLRGTIDWSYDLLSAEEQFTFRHLAVFAGPFTAEAVEALNGGLVTASPALDLLLALADKSLIQSLVDSTGDTRFVLLETLREYGFQKLTAAEADLAGGRLAAFYLALAQTAERQLTGPKQQMWLQRLEVEKPNWLAALQWCATHSAETGLRLAAALGAYWQVRGLLTEARRWLDDFLSRASGSTTDPAAYGRGLRAAVYFTAALGDTARAEQLAHESLRLASDGTPQELADSLSLRGSVALWKNDYAQALPWLTQALELHRQLGDQVNIAVDVDKLGVAAKEQGDYARATAYHEESLALSRALGNTRGIIAALTNLSIAAYWQGDFARVARLAEECLSLCRQINSRVGTALALESLAMATHQQGGHAQAREWLAEALTIYEEASDKGGQALILDDLGQVVHAMGDRGRAVQMHRKALVLAVEIGEPRRAAFCLEGLGAALADTDPALAVQVLSGAQALRQTILAPLPPTEQNSFEAVLAQLSAALGPDRFGSAWSAGQSRSLAEWKDRLLALSY
jgi:predicted ATPase/transcriptional regulator with XRE-family HTH domain